MSLHTINVTVVVAVDGSAGSRAAQLVHTRACSTECKRGSSSECLETRAEQLGIAACRPNASDVNTEMVGMLTSRGCHVVHNVFPSLLREARNVTACN